MYFPSKKQASQCLFPRTWEHSKRNRHPVSVHRRVRVLAGWEGISHSSLPDDLPRPVIFPFCEVAHTAFLNTGSIILGLWKAASCRPLLLWLEATQSHWGPQTLIPTSSFQKPKWSPTLSHNKLPFEKLVLEGNGELPLDGYSFCRRWQVLAMDSGCGCTTLWMLWYQWIAT